MSEPDYEISGLGDFGLWHTTRDGVIWLADRGNSRAFRFDPTSTKWRTFALPDTLVGGYTGQDGSMWFGSRNGAIRYDGENWLRYSSDVGLLDAPIIDMAQTDDGSLWFFGEEVGHLKGVSRYFNGAWSRHTAQEMGLDYVRARNYRDRSILQAKDGSFWFAGQKDGASAASQYDGQNWRVYTRKDGLVGGLLREIEEAPNGDLWFGAHSPWDLDRNLEQGDGVLRFDGETWTSYTVEDGLSHQGISGIHAASDGKVWVGTRHGLNWFDGTSWTRQCTIIA